MANKQIHELPAAATLEPADQLLVSQAGTNLTRRASLASLPFRLPTPGGSPRTLAAKLGESISVKDYGAAGDGVADDSAAFQAALDGHAAVHVPPGTYRLDAEIQVKPRRRLFGAGRDATVIDARAARAFTFNRNEGAFQVDTLAGGDWNRSALSAMTIRMAKGGVRAHGHEFRATGLLFTGGTAPSGQEDADGWCLDLIDANECVVREVQAGYGGGPAHRLLANGIRLRSATPSVNYGDSLVQEVSVKLGAENTVALLLKGNGTGLINNVLLSRVQVNAPQGGSGITPLAGTNGIKLWNAARVVCLLCDVEVVDVSFEEYSESLGGTAGACSNNSYIGCFVHYPGTAAYRDSNALFSRSVIRTTFLGCDNLGPIPVGNVTGDGGRAQDGDLFGQGLWICDQYRQPSIQFRSRDKDVLLITSDQKDAAQAHADGHPSQAAPYRGLLIEHSSKQSTKITRPIANGTLDPAGGATPLTNVRLELGNGEGDARGELARVQVNDPFTFDPAPRSRSARSTGWCGTPPPPPACPPPASTGWATASTPGSTTARRCRWRSRAAPCPSGSATSRSPPPPPISARFTGSTTATRSWSPSRPA
ncbi:MAG TPA: glycosyl hydrolase family 28-related protein [Geminicoccaceae bacterium]|nr:glycosyl hydrolase family 28-related protein [Geminicoccaceae bacterium]